MPIVNTSILGAFAKFTGVVGIDAIIEAIREGVPIKRDENAAAALEAYEAVEAMTQVNIKCRRRRSRIWHNRLIVSKAQYKFTNVEEMPPMAFSLKSTQELPTGSWRNVRPVYKNKTSPCEAGCPAGEKIPAYFDLVRQKKYEEAWHKILEDNPLPGVTGRVCYHPCEGKCNRTFYDESAAIHSIERFVADRNFHNKNFQIIADAPKSEKIAVVGSGPAGLSCAYHLARKGYRAVIYESEQQAGGMLRYGIPHYRLPKNVLDKEIGDIVGIGVDIRTDSRIGNNVPWSELEKYDAVFVAVGATRSKKLAIEGEDQKGIYSGVEFLYQLRSGEIPKIGRNVLVIGGGNTAIDAARSALRLGKKRASILFIGERALRCRQCRRKLKKQKKKA